MAKIQSASEEVVKTLADYLKSNISGIRQVLAEWPAANRALIYPSITIVTQSPEFTPMQRYIHQQGAVGSDNKSEIKFVTGKYDFALQVDLWCRNKEERNEFYEKFFQAFHGQHPSAGLSLVLDDYHGIFCRYEMTGYNYEDNEIASQRNEWRAIIPIIANCKAIVTRDEYIIAETPTKTEIEDAGEIQTEVVVSD